MRMKRIVVLAGTLVSMGASWNWADDEAVTPLKTKLIAVSLFKNGLGFMAREGELPKGDVKLLVEGLPAPVHGTFWVYSRDDGATVEDLVAFEKESAQSIEAVSVAELLEANAGETLELRIGDREAIRGKIIAVPASRPAEPASVPPGRSPYPYNIEEVSFATADGKGTLAATLTLPQGTPPFPGVVLLGGSGPTDRDETVAGHKTFLVLSDFLTRKGIAVLRYDKRGIAQSTGNYADAALEDFVQDAQSAFAYLKSRKEVDAKQLGIIGHSEGGILGSLLATRSSEVHWLVLMGTPVTTGEKTLLRQSELIARAGGLPEEQISRSLEFDRKAYAVVREEKQPEALDKKLNTLIEQSGLAEAMPPAALQAQLRLMASPWFKQFLTYDPEPVLEKLKCPVLALSGDRDLQVDSAENVPLLRKAYETSGDKDFIVVEIEGVNHLFQTAQSGSPALYGAIEETISPAVLTVIGNWIAQHATEHTTNETQIK